MYHIIYLSSATELFSKTELLALLEKSRVNNARLGITGILLYRDGNIIQLLEGEAAAVRSLYQKIARDPRHRGVIILLEGPVAERDFPDWSMAFRDLNLKAETDLPGFSPFLNTSLTPAEFVEKPSQVKSLLQIFKKNML